MTPDLPPVRVAFSDGHPNTMLREFVHEQMSQSRIDAKPEGESTPAFTSPIRTTKVDPIYNLHPYDSKKSHLAIREYIHHYCRPGDLVLDPFCGSGSTLVAASAEGCPSVGIDFSPLATLISAEAVQPRDLSGLDAAIAALSSKLKSKIDALYETSCHRCGGRALITGTVLSEVFQCIRCVTDHPYYACAPTDDEGKRLCPSCARRGIDSVITTSFERRGSRPVEVAFKCLAGCKPSRAKRSILDPDPKVRRALESDIERVSALTAHDVPARLRQRMMGAPEDRERWGLLWRPYLRGFNTVEDFFTPRNLQACLWLLEEITRLGDRSLLVALSAILAKSSHLMAQNPDGIGRVMKGTYYIGALRREVNVWQFFGEACQALLDAKKAINATVKAPAAVSCQNTCALDCIPAGSIAYIFTDPPYSGKVQFGELNYLREAFLGIGCASLENEIIVNEDRAFDEALWTERMRAVAQAMYRVLKPGHWVTLCYHDTSEGTWALVQDVMAEAGFVSDKSESTVYIETSQKSIKQITGDKVNRRDLVVNFRKPLPGEFGDPIAQISDSTDPKTFREVATRVIRDFVQGHPGVSKDRIYDDLVSRMVRSGQMEAHNFDEILREVAEEAKDAGGSRRWYLKEIEESILDAAESAKEDAAAEELERFINKTTAKTYGDGVHYSDLFEHYLYAVKDKPRRALADWLVDYFYKTEDGTWRGPAGDDERELKARARASGTNRRVKRFASMLETGVTIPAKMVPTSASLAEWIRHAKRAGLYEIGKLLYERGGLDMDRLSERVQAEVEEDYQVCTRALQRAAGGTVDTGGKRGRRKKGKSHQ